MLFRFAACAAVLGVSTLAFAQTANTPEKSPEAQAAEEAVRAQAKKFYDFLVAGKPRASESLVCEASKDDYYALNKRTPRSAEVRQVNLAPDLKSANVVVLIEDEFSLGMDKKIFKVPMPSQWKLEQGQWCYSLPPRSDVIDTPFGKMNLKGGGQDKGGDVAAAKAPVNPADLPGRVTFSKRELTLAANADGKDEVEISNGLNGPVQFRLSCPAVEGLVCKLEHDALSANQKGKLLVSFTYKGKTIDAGATVSLWVLPFDSMTAFPIRQPVQPTKH